jgi:hypothetical protein
MRVAVLLALVGCAEPTPDGDVVGPYTGEVRRYAVQEIILPTNGTTARELGESLDDDNYPDNTLGGAMGALGGLGNNATPNAADMIASGVVSSFVEIQADDLIDDASVSVRYAGAAGDDVTLMGGRFEGGTFVSNRTQTTKVPGRARVHFPLFRDADPSVVEVQRMQSELIPEAGGGYLMRVQGVVNVTEARAETARGLVMLMRANPQSHRTMWHLFDTDRDGVIATSEIETDELVVSLLTGDLDDESLSLGFAVRIVPCESGNCVGPPNDTCYDRIHDGDETDLDCGGSCLACPGDATCGDGADCQSGVCDLGRCVAPSCSDGRRDGYESDIDCSGGCAGCVTGKTCSYDEDCASGECEAGVCL